MSSHLWPLVLKCSPTGSLTFFGLNGRAVVVDPSAEVTCFTIILLKADFATDEIDAVGCAAKGVAKYLVGATHDGASKTVRVGAVSAQKASGTGTRPKTTSRQRAALPCPHHHVLKNKIG